MLIVALLLTDCSKREMPTKENFYLYGHLKDFTSGKPLANMKIRAVGATAASGGMFGTSSVNYELGQTTTDDSGYFNITPLKISGIKYYCIVADSDIVNISYFKNITSDSMIKNPLPGYDLSYNMNSYAYLKVSFTDTSAPDSSDILILNVNCTGNTAGPGFNSIQYSSNPLPGPEELDFFKGRITNGFAIFKVLGNNSNDIIYSKSSKAGLARYAGASVFCKANDTTNYTVKY